jgi:ribosomal protein L40E
MSDGSKKQCPACYGEIDARATICRHCRTAQVQPQAIRGGAQIERKNSGCGTVLLVVGAVALVGGFLCFRTAVNTPHPDSLAWKNDPANSVCGRWPGLSDDLRRGSVAGSLQTLVGERIDGACLERRIDELVRRRLCP